MSAGTGLAGLHLVGLQELRKNWGWFLALGIILVVLGMIALGASVAMTLAGVFFFGWLLIVGGVLEAVHAFWREKGWGGFFIDLLTGILYVVVGFLLVANPAASALALTLLIAFFLMFGGLFRIVVAVAVRFHNWVWLLLHGVVNLLLGLLIWRQWPLSGLWVIGLFIGIDLLFNGWSLVMLGLAARKIPADTAAAVPQPA
ncbi:MAG: HdeD family acid-resistance protein [Pirellulaceae bacterium]|nr:HdeD family acid-resistance protein [Pirellulaceae bacterium]